MNNINDMNTINNLSFLNDSLRVEQNNSTTDSENIFGTIFNSAVRLFDETSRTEHEAHQLQMDYISGRTDDMLAVILAEQRALTAVTFTSQVLSNVMDAYRQIMNLQV